MAVKLSLKQVGLIILLGAMPSIALSRLLPQAWNAGSLAIGVGTLGTVIALLILMWRSADGLTASQNAVLKKQGLFVAGWLLLVSAPTFVLAGPGPMIISAAAGGLIASLLWIVRLR